MKIAEGWEIPTMRLYPELYDDVKKLYGKFGQSEVDQETVARLWGHKSAKSSQFRVVKLGSLRSYGLIEGRGKIRVSDLGRRLTYPKNEKEAMDAIVEAIKNIPLWRALFDTFTANGKDLPTDTFWMDLRRIVGEDKLPPEESQNKAEIVRKAYLEDIRYYKPVIEAKMEAKMVSTPTQPTRIDKSVPTPAEATPLDEQASIVSGLIKQGAYDIAKQFIDFIKAKQEKVQKTEPEGDK
jgi:hypothetical protein